MHPALDAGIPQATIDAIQESVLSSRVGQADDVAQLALFRPSDESAFVNGQVWRVDGGLHAHASQCASRLRHEQ